MDRETQREKEEEITRKKDKLFKIYLSVVWPSFGPRSKNK